jgi:hypothetical protein
MKYIIFLLALALLTLSGCVSDLDIPLPEHTPRLVAQSELIPGEPFYVYLTRSYPIDERPTIAELLVSDATVEIWSEGNRLETLVYRDSVYWQGDPENSLMGRYASTALRVEAGRSYELRASHPSYPSLRADANIPVTPAVVDVTLIKDTIDQQNAFDDFVRLGSILRVTLDDPAGVANYYDFDAIVYYQDTTFGTREDTNFQTLFLERNLAYDIDGSLIGDNEPVSDQGFDGQRARIDLLAYLPDGCCWNDPNDRPQIQLYAIELRIRSLEKPLNDYLRQLRLQGNGNFNGIAGALLPSEPITIGGNVEGGLGFFAGEARVPYRWTP